MQEERQPQAIELIWDLWVEKRQQATHIIHAVHLMKGIFKRTATVCESKLHLVVHQLWFRFTD